jgi:hypothetical protein
MYISGVVTAVATFWLDIRFTPHLIREGFFFDTS